jgi:catalase
VVADGAPKDGDFRALVLLQEAFRHLKAVGAWGDGMEVLQAAGIDPDAPGVLVGRKANAKLATGLIAALGLHRAWDRTPLVNASLVPPTV